jgi:hypothetical protein
MITHKQCPKCRGNIYFSEDYYGKYEECLQCGYTYDLSSTCVAPIPPRFPSAVEQTMTNG